MIPFQIYLLGLTWIIARRTASTNFHPLIALAWVLVTNALAMIPVYFVSFLTGQLLLGRWSDLIGYQGFQDIWLAVTGGDGELSGILGMVAEVALGPFGAVLFIGSLPYAFGVANSGNARLPREGS